MDIQRKILGTFAGKGEVEKAISVGMHGAPELKKDEKMHFLGNFKERVIKMLTKDQVKKKSIYPEIITALKNKQASRLLIDGSIDQKYFRKYIDLAKDEGKFFTVIHDPELQGNCGLIVASDSWVDVKEIKVED